MLQWHQRYKDGKWQQAAQKLAKKRATLYKCPLARGNRTITLVLIPAENTKKEQETATWRLNMGFRINFGLSKVLIFKTNV